MRIAVCDDELFYREKIIELIQEYKRTRQGLSLTLSAFASADELLRFTSVHGRYDLYILDIIMPETDGIQLGSALRKSGDGGLIVYLTTSPEFAVDSYTVEAFHYLLKPVDTRSFFQCLNKAAGYIDRLKKKVVAIRTSGSVRMVPIQDICYAERVGRQVCYYLSDGSCLNSTTFNDAFHNAAAPLLAHEEVLLVGSSFAVNLCHVTEITKRDLIVDSGRKIAIPRGKYQLYKTAWFDYWLSDTFSP